MVKKGGRLVMNGIPTEPIEIPWAKVVLDEIDMLGVRANPNTSVPALALIANGSVTVGPILSHTFPLAEFGEALGDGRGAARRRHEGRRAAVTALRRPTTCADAARPATRCSDASCAASPTSCGGGPSTCCGKPRPGTRAAR